MDPLNQSPMTSTVASAPVSPQAAPGISDTTSVASEMSQEQMKANLQDLMSKIDAKYQDFNSHKFSSDNKLKEQQSQSLREIFDLLQSVGVDPSNPEEVSSFLDKMKGQNPELYQQLVQVLQSVLGSDSVDQGLSVQAQSGVPADNMNINTNDVTQQNI